MLLTAFPEQIVELAGSIERVVAGSVHATVTVANVALSHLPGLVAVAVNDPLVYMMDGSIPLMVQFVPLTVPVANVVSVKSV